MTFKTHINDVICQSAETLTDVPILKVILHPKSTLRIEVSPPVGLKCDSVLLQLVLPFGNEVNPAYRRLSPFMPLHS